MKPEHMTKEELIEALDRMIKESSDRLCTKCGLYYRTTFHDGNIPDYECPWCGDKGDRC